MQFRGKDDFLNAGNSNWEATYDYSTDSFYLFLPALINIQPMSFQVAVLLQVLDIYYTKTGYLNYPRQSIRYDYVQINPSSNAM